MDDESAHDPVAFSGMAIPDITSKIAVVAIIVLFIAVLLVLLLHLYAKLFWWRIEQQAPPAPQQMRRRRRRFVFVPGQDPLHTGRLHPLLLQTLPIIDFRPQEFKDGLECAVCLSELIDGDKARILPKCNHGFHVDCIDMWFQSHSTCPICRDTVAVLGQECSNSKSVAGSVADGAETFTNNHEQPQIPNSGSGFSVEAPNFPTNVLVWGNQNQVSTGNASIEDGGTNSPSGPCSSSATAVSATTGTSVTRAQDGVMLIDIHDSAHLSENLSSSSIRFVEEESKSSVTTRLRSLKRLLSREKRVVTSCSTSNSADA